MNTPSPQPINHKTDLQPERLRLIFDGTRSNCYLTFGLVAVFLFLLGGVAKPIELGAWALAMVLLSLARIYLTHRFFSDENALSHKAVWERVVLGSLALSAVLWAFPVAFLVRAADITTQFLIAWFVGCVVLGSMTTLTAWFKAFALFSCLTLTINGIATLLRPGKDQLILALAFFLFQPLLLMAGRLIGRVYDRSLAIGSDNQKLVEQLRKESERAKAGERRFATLANALDVALYVRDFATGRVLYANPAAERLVGSRPGEWVGEDIHDLVHPEDRQRIREMAMSQDRAPGERLSFDARLLNRGGESIWGHVSSTVSEFEGSPAVIGAVVDITPRMKAEQQLAKEKERAQTTLNSIAEGVITTGENGQIQFVNPVAEKLLGIRNEVAVGKMLFEILKLRSDVNPQLTKKLQQWLESPTENWQTGGDLVLIDAEGDELPIELTAAPIQTDNGQSHGTVLVLRDVSEIRSLTKMLAYQAQHDPLTGLVNRREFENRFNRLLSDEADDTTHALLFIDLDQFKLVNDRGGHAAGDELLRQIGDRMSSLMRSEDILSRLGGDEFAVLLKNCSLDVAQERAEAIRLLLRDFVFTWGGTRFELGGSIGLAAVTASSGTVQEVLSAADMACYVAKEQGRNRVQVYQPDDESLMAQRGQMDWLQRLQSALKEDRFELVIQEIWPLSSELPDGMRGEMLLRMIDENGERIAPGLFMGAAERYHLMPDIDRWVLRNTFQWVNQIAPLTQSYKLFGVNISAQSLAEDNFLDYILDLFKSEAIDPSLICFELTESTAITNLEKASHFIQTLRQKGCLFSLDDFGSGASSFSYLKQLPLDSLKIDGSFVRDINRHAQDRAVVESICQVGKVMGIHTVAEHVENEEILDTLRHVGVDLVQGYAVHRPEPLSAWSHHLTHGIRQKHYSS